MKLNLDRITTKLKLLKKQLTYCKDLTKCWNMTSIEHQQAGATIDLSILMTKSKEMKGIVRSDWPLLKSIHRKSEKYSTKWILSKKTIFKFRKIWLFKDKKMEHQPTELYKYLLKQKIRTNLFILSRHREVKPRRILTW